MLSKQTIGMTFIFCFVLVESESIYLIFSEMKLSLLILPLLSSGCLCSSEDDPEVQYISVQLGGRVTLNCGKSPDKWILNKNNTEEIIEEGEAMIQRDTDKV